MRGTEIRKKNHPRADDDKRRQMMMMMMMMTMMMRPVCLTKLQIYEVRLSFRNAQE
jgi:hypothetical protein